MKISRELKVGLLFVATLALFIYGFNFLKGRDIFHKERVFFAVYPAVNGLVSSSPVYVNGLKVGLVKEIGFHPDGSNNVLVNMALTNDIVVPSNTIARIYSSDIMGSKAIELILGDGLSPAKPGDTLATDVQASLQDEVNRQVLPLKKKAEALMGSIDSAFTVIRYVFNDKTRENLESSFLSIKLTIQNLENTTYNIDTLVSTQKGRMALILANIEGITSNVRNNNRKITDILTNINSITDTLVRSNISQTFTLLNQTLSKTAGIMEKIDRGEGSLGLLINNDRLYKELEKSSKDLNLLLEDMRLNPNRYIHFSVFGKGSRKNAYAPPVKQ